MGGIDWQGLDLVTELFGITDVEGLVQRLAVIKLHKPPNNNPNPG